MASFHRDGHKYCYCRKMECHRLLLVMCDIYTYRNIEISWYSWCIGIHYSHAASISIFLKVQVLCNLTIQAVSLPLFQLVFLKSNHGNFSATHALHHDYKARCIMIQAYRTSLIVVLITYFVVINEICSKNVWHQLNSLYNHLCCFRGK